MGHKVLSKYPGMGKKLYPARVLAVYNNTDDVMVTWDDIDINNRIRKRSDLFPPNISQSKVSILFATSACMPY